jgi:type I restriction enzyme R subunit
MTHSEHPTPLWLEDHASQVPALQLLQNLGWTYLTPGEALAMRGGRPSNVLLEGVLEVHLPKMNRIRYRGEEYPFSDSSIHGAIEALKNLVFDGLIRTNEKAYDLLCLGKSLQQSVRGDLKSFTLQYINWLEPDRNVYHVTEEFAVERTGTKDTYVPDIVLFVNGIPLAVIECKRTDLGPGRDPVDQAISQHLRNQKDDGIPRLFLYSQLLLAVSRNSAKYATTGTPKKFWAAWRELGDTDAVIRGDINRPLDAAQKSKLFGDRFSYVREHFDSLEGSGGREVTEQDRTVWSLCKPKRMLDLSYRYILFDAGVKKVARYQQFFTVENTLNRIRRLDQGERRGGVVWHTQGSGKSLTMVMLAKAIALEKSIGEHKVVLVTDRVDLDEQIEGTFKHCGMAPERANTGSDLIEMLTSRKHRVITTVINKFEAADNKGVRIDDPNIFVLVDEGHRTQFGSRHGLMRGALPTACFIGFTGTPVRKRDKSTVERFGGLILPIYSIHRAVEDASVVPLLYEGRHIAESVRSDAIDEWFDRVTAGLTEKQRADLKKRFTTTDMLFRSEPVVRAIAWDVSTHFRDNWKHTPFKGQLVAPRKETAILYKQLLDEFGMVKSEVLISGPDDREGEEDIYQSNTDKVLQWWNATVGKNGRFQTEKEYNRQIINSFKFGDPHDDEAASEIIIVVDKLLTGFDSPNNTVLYLARTLREHTLLQAIARVNRLHDGKEYGYIIDYRGVLPELRQALEAYADFPGVEASDLTDTVRDIAEIIDKLPQHHSDLWSCFQEIRNKRDQEEYERLLADDALRVQFYERFARFSRTLADARSSAAYVEIAEQRRQRYQNDLAFFGVLRSAVRRRYAETIDFSEYEPKIRKLLDNYVGVETVEQIAGPINLFDSQERNKAIEAAHGDAAKADTIAHNTKRLLDEKWSKEDPAFYKKFSLMLQETITGFLTKRLTEAQYLQQALNLEKSVVTRTGDDVPESIRHNATARAYYGTIKDVLETSRADRSDLKTIAAEAAYWIDRLIENRRIVDWTTNPDVQNRMRQEIEDYLLDIGNTTGLDLGFDEVDTILDECLGIARNTRS